MKASTKAVTVEIDDAMAKLAAQCERSVAVLTEVAGELVINTNKAVQATANRLLREADRLRATAQI